MQYTIRLLKPTDKQNEFIYSPVKGKIIRAGRRGGNKMLPRKDKRFCNDKCRWKYSNNLMRAWLQAFAEEINDLLERHGLLRYAGSLTDL